MPTIDWISGSVSGDWSDASDWVGGVVPVAGDAAVISAAGAYTVTIDDAEAAASLTVNDADATVSASNTLTLTGALTLSAGTFQLNGGAAIDGGTLSATDGTFDWQGGTLSGVTVKGTLDLSSTAYIPEVIVGSGGITLTGTGGTGAGTVDLTGFVASLQVTGGASINNATIDIGNSGSGDSLELYDPNGATPVLTLGNKLIVDQVGALATIGADPGYNIDTVVNTGTIEAAYSGGVFTINAPNFVNDGAITISSGDTINLYSGTGLGTGTFTEDAGGSFTVGSGGLLAMGYNQTTAQLASITNKGAIAIDATLTNGGSTLTVGSGTSEPTIQLGDPSFSSGAIVGGTIVDKGSGMVFDTGSLSDVTYDGTMDLSPANSSVYVSGGLTEFGENGTGAGEINLTGAGSTFNAFGGQTLNNVTMDIGNSTNQAAFQFYNPGDANPTLTLGSSFAIVQTGGAAAIYGVYNGATDQLVNDGSITAAVSGSSFYIGSLPIFTNNGSISVSNSDTLTIAPTVSFTEGASGTLSVASGGTLNLNFALTTAQLLKISDSAGVIGVGTNSTGTLTNTGATLTVGTGAADPTVVVGGNGTIVGGTIVDKGSGLQFGYGATLSGVTYDGTLNVNQSLNVTGGLTVNAVNGSSPGVINDTSYNTGITFDGGETIDNATLDIGYYSSLNVYNTTANNTVLTLGSHFNIDQVGPISTININNLSLINDGTITVGLSGGIFDIYGANFTNNGTIAVSDGDSLTIQTTTFTQGATGSVTVATGGILNLNVNLTTANLAGVTNSGGTVGIQGTLTNTGATLTVGPGTAEPSIDLDGGGEIVGGTIVDKGSGIFFNGGTLSGVTYDGVMDLSPEYSAVTVTGGLTVTGENGTGPGVINLTGFITQFNAFGGQTLNNATLNMGNGASLGIVDPDGLHTTLTLGSTFKIVQSSNGGDIGGGSNSNDVIVNDGTITAGVAGNGLSITPTNFTNNGSLIATTGGLLTVQPGTLTNLSGTTLTGGTFEADAGSTIELNQNAQIVTLAATVILSGSGSTIEGYDTTTSAEVGIDATLTTIAVGGDLELLAGRDWTTTAATSNTGTLDLGGGTVTAPTIANSGVVVGYGEIATTISNTGTLNAVAGETLSLPDTLTNLSGTTLTGGTYIVGAGGTLQLAENVSIVTLKATVDLAGTGATIQSLDTTTSKQVTLQSSLKTIGVAGDLEILGKGAYTTANALSNSGTIQLGGGILTSGKLIDAAGSELTGFGTVASVFTDAGTVTASGGALSFTAAGDTFAGALNGSQITFNGGTEALYTGASLGATTWTVSNGASVSVNANVTDTGALTAAAGTTITISSTDTLTLTGTGSTIAGAITDSGGTLTFGGGTQAINAGATITTTNWTLSGGAKVSINENLTYAGTFSAGAGTTLTIAAGHTLTLTGGASFAGSVNGGGTLVLSGATDTLNAGATLSAASVSLSGGATMNVDGASTISGAFSQAAGATVSVSAGDTLTVSGTGSTLAGAVGGAGTLALSGGTDALDDTAGFTVANWSLSGTASATLGGALIYAGKLTQGAGTTLTLGANALTLTGSGSSLAGSVTGTATLAFSGGTDTLAAGASFSVANVSLSNSTAVTASGAATVSGAVSEASGSSLSIDSGDTLTLTDGAGIAGAIDGPGVLKLSGKTTTFKAGASVAGAGLTLASAAVADINTAIGVSGVLAAATGTNIVVAGSDNLSLTGTGSTLAGTVSGAGTLAFAGGTQAVNAGATMSVTDWSLSGGTATSVNESLTYAKTFSDSSGTTLTIASGKTLTLSGASTFAGTITGAGALTLSGGTDAFDTGTAIGAATTSTAKHAALSINADVTDTGAFLEGFGTTLTISSGDTLTLSGTGTVLGGPVSGAGTLAFAGGTQTIKTLTIATSAWTLSGGAVTSFDVNFGYAGDLTLGSGTVLALGDGSLNLSGSGSALAGSIRGTALTFAAGSQAIDAGASIATASWSMFGGAAVEISESLTYAGTFAKAAGASLAIASGDALTLTGASTLAGNISGAGKLVLSKGTDTINGGATLSVATVGIGNGATLNADANTTISGALSQAAGTTLTIGAADTVTLTGAGSVLAGTVTGGTFATKAGATLAGLTLGGGVTWDNFATATQTAATILGDGVSGAVSIVNQAGATWNITSNSGVAITGSGGSITNDGLFEKTAGTGDSVIAAAMDNANAIKVASGELEFSQAVTGAGTATIATGGTLKLDAAFNENVTFAAAGAGTLELADSQTYGGSISGLSKTGANSLDLLDIDPADFPTWSYSGTTTAGVLTVTDSAHHTAAIHLTGDYLGQSFTLSTGADGGTKVVDPPAQGGSDSPAATHQFVTTMAAFGARPATTAHTGSHVATAIGAWLAAPISLYSV